MPRHPWFTEEHEMFLEVVDRFVEQHCGREYARACDSERRYPYEAYAAFAEQGWFGLCVPEAEGGMGADVLFRTILQEGLARHAFDFGAVYGLTCWGIDTLLAFGTADQKARYIPPALAGRLRFSISMTEPNAGSDLTGIRLAAVEDGDDFVLNGQKVFASAAGADDNVIILAARTARSATDRRHGLTMFLVPKDTPGVELRKMPTLSRRMSGTYECFYTDVRVPRTNIVGRLHEGWEVLGAFLVQERIGGAAMYVGNARTALDDALRYAKDRRQFGQAIGSFQSINHALADAACEIEAARLLTYQAAWLAAQGVPALKEAAMAKLYASEAGFRVATLGMQVLGGYAQLPEFDMERYWRDAKQNTVSAGTSQIQRNIIGAALGLRK
jgi:alkylation response protein AidB-like acyl-CoA dehydrogenase